MFKEIGAENINTQHPKPLNKQHVKICKVLNASHVCDVGPQGCLLVKMC